MTIIYVCNCGDENINGMPPYIDTMYKVPQRVITSLQAVELRLFSQAE